MKQSKILFLTLLFMGLVGLTFALNNKPAVAAKSEAEVKTEAKLLTTWRYVGTANPGVFADEANWEIGASSDPNCADEGDIPCQLTAEAADENELRDHLDGMSNTQVLDISDSKKF